MITADHREGEGLIVDLHSDSNNKEAHVWITGGKWQIVYKENGQRKSGLESYQACLDYLKSKGW